MTDFIPSNRVLAIDTAMDRCAAALFDPTSDIALVRVESCLHGHAARLVPMVEGLIREANTSYDQIGLIAVTTGPGSFTGIRVGLSCARGLALALDVPVRGFGTLETLARQAREEEDLAGPPLLVLVETRRENFFARTFSPDGRALGAPQDSPAAQIVFTPETVLAGDGAARFQASRTEASALRLAKGARNVDPACLARWAAQEETASAPPRPVTPLYIRPADVYGKSASRPNSGSAGTL